MAIYDSGPAFPQHHSAANVEDRRQGMSLRDWFAGQALSAFSLTNGPNGEDESTLIAADAYGVADAMLAARLKERG